MKTPKRTKVCPKCGETATLKWQTSRGCLNERINYAEWRCPKCKQRINSIYRDDVVDFARCHRKNRVRQLKHTITRLTALANMGNPFDEPNWKILGRDDETIAKGLARAALWKRAAKKWWKAEWTCWEMAENMANQMIELKEKIRVLEDELEDERVMRETAMKWRAHYKEECEKLKGLRVL